MSHSQEGLSVLHLTRVLRRKPWSLLTCLAILHLKPHPLHLPPTWQLHLLPNRQVAQGFPLSPALPGPHRKVRQVLMLAITLAL